MARTRQAIVLGGGISGLTAAQALQHNGVDYTLLERSPTLGGLTRTIAVGDYCFDYTGHLLHLSHYPTPADIPFARLSNDDWRPVERNSKCLLEGKLITAPIQYNLWELPAPMLELAVTSYDRRPTSGNGTVPGTFRDYVISGFGQYLADVFLIPQNEKTMSIALDKLSPSAVKRFFPPPIEERVRHGMVPSTSRPPEYNSCFWYPRDTGIQSLVDGLKRDLHGVNTCKDVVNIDIKDRVVATADGARYRWSKLLSSIPLCDLCRLTGDPDLSAAARHQTHSSTIIFNLGVRGELPSDLQGVHWVYVPDRSIPFYRVGVYSNISSRLCAPGHYELYVEVGFPGDKVDEVDIVNDLQPRVFESLRRLGWVAAQGIMTCVVHLIRCAYVHFTPERESVMADLFSRLHECDVIPIGRYGQWDYTSMEDSIRSALAAVDKVAARRPKVGIA